MNWRFIFTWLMIGGFCLIIYWGPLALMITVACVQVKVLFLKHLDWKPDLLLHVVTHVPSIVLCWDYQHRIRRLQNGQPSLVPVSLLVCSIFKLLRQIVSWHSGISSSLPTIFSTERPLWSNSVLSSTGYKTLINSDIIMRSINLGRLPPLPGAIPSTDIFCPLHPRLCLVCALLGEEVLSATGKDLM